MFSRLPGGCENPTPMSFAAVFQVYEAIIAIALIIAGILVAFEGLVSREWGTLMVLLGVLLLIFWLSGLQAHFLRSFCRAYEAVGTPHHDPEETMSLAARCAVSRRSWDQIRLDTQSTAAALSRCQRPCTFTPTADLSPSRPTARTGGRASCRCACVYPADSSRRCPHSQ